MAGDDHFEALQRGARGDPPNGSFGSWSLGRAEWERRNASSGGRSTASSAASFQAGQVGGEAFASLLFAAAILGVVALAVLVFVGLVALAIPILPWTLVLRRRGIGWIRTTLTLELTALTTLFGLWYVVDEVLRGPVLSRTLPFPLPLGPLDVVIGVLVIAAFVALGSACLRVLLEREVTMRRASIVLVGALGSALLGLSAFSTPPPPSSETKLWVPVARFYKGTFYDGRWPVDKTGCTWRDLPTETGLDGVDYVHVGILRTRDLFCDGTTWRCRARGEAVTCEKR